MVPCYALGNMLAYVFWHWKRASIDAGEYEARQRAFHAALASTPPDGFEQSSCARLTGAPWAAAGSAAYEDWYLVRDFTALGVLKDAAIRASRQAPHDAAAAASLGGTAGVYALQAGTALAAPTHAYWFAKPEGMSYPELSAALTPIVRASGAALWLRQLVLGPARELCLHAPARLALPSAFTALDLTLEPVWTSA
jgi:hypothetical protein